MRANVVTVETLRRRIRRLWRRYVLPAYTGRDAATLLTALIAANASLDELLQAEEYVGDTAAERLRSASHSFSDYAGLCAARSVRHRAVHHLGYPLCRRVAIPALQAYGRALWEHGVDLDAPWREEPAPPTRSPAASDGCGSCPCAALAVAETAEQASGAAPAV